MAGKRVRLSPVEAKNRVYELCNKEQWFTAGGNSAYEKMFSLVSDGRPLSEIALAIWICSSDVELGEINRVLDEALYVSESPEE